MSMNIEWRTWEKKIQEFIYELLYYYISNTPILEHLLFIIIIPSLFKVHILLGSFLFFIYLILILHRADIIRIKKYILILVWKF